MPPEIADCAEGSSAIIVLDPGVLARARSSGVSRSRSGSAHRRDPIAGEMSNPIVKCVPNLQLACVPHHRPPPPGPHTLPPSDYIGVWLGADGSPLHICKEGTMSITFIGDAHVVHSGALKGLLHASLSPRLATVMPPP